MHLKKKEVCCTFLFYYLLL